MTCINSPQQFLIRQRHYLWAVLVVLVCVPALQARAQGQMLFQAAWPDSWRSAHQPDSCVLELNLAELGFARFVGDRHSPVSFELQTRKDIFARGNLQVARFTPAWLSTEGRMTRMQALGVAAHIRGGGAIVRGPTAQDMLWALRDGHHLRISAAAAHNPNAEVAVDLKAAGLPALLEDFLHCAHTPVSVSWQQIARTRISHGVDEYALTPAAKNQLAAVISYVRQDPSVTTLFVDGHADASGDKQNNYRLSKRRAQAVAAFLREQGLADRNIVVRFHGAAYPVGKNRYARGKAMNRRTTVRLERAAEDLLAGN